MEKKLPTKQSGVSAIPRATKEGATAPFKLGGHPVQRLIGDRKRGVGKSYLVLWGDGTNTWAPASDVKKVPELLRAYKESQK